MKETNAHAVIQSILVTAYENAHTHLSLFAKTGKQKYYDAAMEILSQAKELEILDTTNLDAKYDRQAEIDRQALQIAKSL